MAYRSRDANNRADRETSVPAGGGGGGSDINLWVEPVLEDQDSTKSPPGSPAIGDRHIVPGGATGAWAGKGGEIAEWTGSAWSFTQTLVEGSESFVTRREKVIHLVEFNEPGDYPNEQVFATQSFVRSWLNDVLIDYLTNVFAGSIIDTRNTPPATPLHGDRYIVGSVPTGVWASVGSGVNTIAMAVRDLTTHTYKWVHRTPDVGTIVYDTSATGLKRWNGSAWVPFPSLVSLSDVNITTGAGVDGYVVTYDHATGKFILNVGPAAAPHTLVSHSDVNIVTGAGIDGFAITWDNGTGKWIATAGAAPGAHTLDSHSNVSTGAKVAGSVLQWNGANWVPGFTVVITAPVNGQGLVYSGGTWINGNPTVAAHNHTLDSLSNVSTGGKAVGDGLQWDGVNWVKHTWILNDLGDVTISGPTTGQALIYDGVGWVNGTATAAVPTGTGRTAALWAGAVGSGSWQYTVVGSTAFQGSWPYYIIPAGYTKARVTTTYSNNVTPLLGSARGNSLGTGSDIGVGCIVASGALVAGFSTNVVDYFFGTGKVSGGKEQRLEFTTHVFQVVTGWRLYPFNDSSGTAPFVDTNPMFMQIELFT